MRWCGAAWAVPPARPHRCPPRLRRVVLAGGLHGLAGLGGNWAGREGRDGLSTKMGSCKKTTNPLKRTFIFFVKFRNLETWILDENIDVSHKQRCT